MDATYYIESHLAKAGALVAAATWVGVDATRELVLGESIPGLLSAVVSVSGISVGFLLTAKSILISVDDRPIIGRIKEAKLYGRILRAMRGAIAWSFALTVLSVIGLIFDYKSTSAPSALRMTLVAAWIGTAAGAMLSFLRVSRIWWALMDILDTKLP